MLDEIIRSISAVTQYTWWRIRAYNYAVMYHASLHSFGHD